ncbi:MAG: hypothetical protein ACRD0L_12680, partial [Acidimicrobiales bacterium]
SRGRRSRPRSGLTHVLGMVVVDDALLLTVLAERIPASVPTLVAAAADGEVFTTGCWYWRLSRALARPSLGALSRAVASLSDDEQRRARASLETLPDEIGLLSLRRLVPVMQALPGQLNLLTAEAVAAAAILDGALVVSTESPLLSSAAQASGVAVTLATL